MKKKIGIDHKDNLSDIQKQNLTGSVGGYYFCVIDGDLQIVGNTTIKGNRILSGFTTMSGVGSALENSPLINIFEMEIDKIYNFVKLEYIEEDGQLSHIYYAFDKFQDYLEFIITLAQYIERVNQNFIENMDSLEICKNCKEYFQGYCTKKEEYTIPVESCDEFEKVSDIQREYEER